MLTAGSASTGLGLIREFSEVIEDVRHTCLHEDGFERPNPDVVKVLLVVVQRFLSARAVGAEELRAGLEETAVQYSPEATFCCIELLCGVSVSRHFLQYFKT